MPAQLTDLVAAIRNALDAVHGVGLVFDSYAGPNLTEADFPVVVFSVAPVHVSTFMPGAAGAVDQVTGGVTVYHFSLAPLGTQAMRELMDKTQEALHQSNITTATDWNSIQTRLVSRSPIDALGEGMYRQVDQYNLIGEGTI